MTQVSTTNVSRLQPSWSFDLGTTGVLEATPIVANGVMYVTGPRHAVTAIIPSDNRRKER